MPAHTLPSSDLQKRKLRHRERKLNKKPSHMSLGCGRVLHAATQLSCRVSAQDEPCSQSILTVYGTLPENHLTALRCSSCSLHRVLTLVSPRTQTMDNPGANTLNHQDRQETVSMCSSGQRVSMCFGPLVERSWCPNFSCCQWSPTNPDLCYSPGGAATPRIDSRFN